MQLSRSCLIVLVVVGHFLEIRLFAESQPTVGSVIARYIYLQGGEEKLSTLSTLKIEGEITIESQGLKFPVTQMIQSPDKSYTVQDFPSLGIIREVLNGEAGWEWHPITGERPLDPGEIRDKLKEADLQRDLKLFKYYKEIKFGQPEQIEGHETIHLILLDEEGRKEHWYFLENGDLFQKIHTVSSGPESEFETTDRYYDFETIDGFRFPTRVHFINPVYLAEFRITDCEINVPIDPEVFGLPEPILE
jgi:hypothetical protein